MNFQVSIDVGAFEQVIQALHRLMDLKEKYLDVEVCMTKTNRNGWTSLLHPSLLNPVFNLAIQLLSINCFQILGILVRSVVSGREDNKGLSGK